MLQGWAVKGRADRSWPDEHPERTGVGVLRGGGGGPERTGWVVWHRMMTLARWSLCLM